MNKIIYLFIAFYLLSGCQSMEDALTLKKKKSSDEFLIEKKSPLVLPPKYGELPQPGEKKSVYGKNKKVESTLNSEELKINKVIKNSEPTPLEKSILEKMK